VRHLATDRRRNTVAAVVAQVLRPQAVLHITAGILYMVVAAVAAAVAIVLGALPRLGEALGVEGDIMQAETGMLAEWGTKTVRRRIVGNRLRRFLARHLCAVVEAAVAAELSTQPPELDTVVTVSNLEAVAAAAGRVNQTQAHLERAETAETGWS
jgi:hypothetical protein